MKTLTNYQRTNVALRAAMLMKDVGEIIGCEDTLVIKMIVAGIKDKLRGLEDELRKYNGTDQAQPCCNRTNRDCDCDPKGT